MRWAAMAADNFATLGLSTSPEFLGEDPTLERSFRGHKDAVSSVAWNPNLKQLITGSLDCSVMVWNFKPALRAFRFSGHKVHAVPAVCQLRRLSSPARCFC